MKLVVTLLGFLIVCVGTAVGVKCYVGVGANTVVMDCGKTSNKCIKTTVNELTAQVCYSQMDWSRFPTYRPTVGCQTYSTLGTEICICVGDKCNGDGLSAKSGSATSKLPPVYKPTAKFEAVTRWTPAPTEADVGFGIHHVSTTNLMIHRHNGKHATTPTPISTTGVRCYVGIGEHTFIKHCDGPSDRCVKSQVNGVISKVCYSDMTWSKFPAFDPRLGCQKTSGGETKVEMCICSGDKCNAGGFDGTDSTTHLPDTTKTPKQSKIYVQPHVTYANDLSRCRGGNRVMVFGLKSGAHMSIGFASGSSLKAGTDSTSEPIGDEVTCAAGIGSTTFDMDCGPATSKCVWSKVNDVVAKVCYNKMQWSQYPMFDPRVGCQEATTNDVHVKICICEGDNCNEHEPSGKSLVPNKRKHGLAPTATAIRDTTSGAINMYTTSISTILLLAIAGYLLQ